jgi:hypothetical protein
MTLHLGGWQTRQVIVYKCVVWYDQSLNGHYYSSQAANVAVTFRVQLGYQHPNNISENRFDHKTQSGETTVNQQFHFCCNNPKCGHELFLVRSTFWSLLPFWCILTLFHYLSNMLRTNRALKWAKVDQYWSTDNWDTTLNKSVAGLVGHPVQVRINFANRA